MVLGDWIKSQESRTKSQELRNKIWDVRFETWDGRRGILGNKEVRTEKLNHSFHKSPITQYSNDYGPKSMKLLSQASHLDSWILVLGSGSLMHSIRPHFQVSQDIGFDAEHFLPALLHYLSRHILLGQLNEIFVMACFRHHKLVIKLLQLFVLQVFSENRQAYL